MIKKIWNEFKALKWYWKLLLLVPFLLAVVVFGIFYFFPAEIKFNDKLIKYRKELVDNTIRQNLKTISKEQEKVNKLKEEHKQIIKEKDILSNKMEKKRKEYDELEKKISSTNPTIDDITDMLAELRKVRRARISKRNNPTKK